MFDIEDAENIVKTGLYHLKHHGFWKCKFTAPDELTKNLKNKIMAGLENQHGEQVVKDITNGKDGAPLQVKGNAHWLSTIEKMYELSGDPILLGIVQAYMGVPPIFNTPATFLNSFAKTKKAKDLSDLAQLYHHDMHRLQFVKLFIYLTDVDLEAGPHTLIRGTHRERPDNLRWSPIMRQ